MRTIVLSPASAGVVPAQRALTAASTPSTRSAESAPGNVTAAAPERARAVVPEVVVANAASSPRPSGSDPPRPARPTLSVAQPAPSRLAASGSIGAPPSSDARTTLARQLRSPSAAWAGAAAAAVPAAARTVAQAAIRPRRALRGGDCMGC